MVKIERALQLLDWTVYFKPNIDGQRDSQESAIYQALRTFLVKILRNLEPVAIGPNVTLTRLNVERVLIGFDRVQQLLDVWCQARSGSIGWLLRMLTEISVSNE